MQEVVKNRIKYKEDELLDLYNAKIEGKDPKIIQQRNKLLKKIKKNEYRMWTLKYLIENVGRGSNKALKYIHVKKDDDQIIETVH